MTTKINLIDFGQRLQGLRKNKGYSADKLAGALKNKGVFISRQSIRELEKGSATSFDFIKLTAICELLECDLSYLLGLHPTKRHEAASVHEITGLDEEVIDTLAQLKELSKDENYYFSPLDFINAICSGTIQRGDERSYLTGVLSSVNTLVVLSAPPTLDELKSRDIHKLHALKFYYAGKIQQDFLNLAQKIYEKHETEATIKQLRKERDNWYELFNDEHFLRLRNDRFRGHRDFNFDIIEKEEAENGKHNETDE